ncbi:MAG TPA: ABC transporter substrate-binding protein [Opitutaceae bacterium]
MTSSLRPALLWFAVLGGMNAAIAQETPLAQPAAFVQHAVDDVLSVVFPEAVDHSADLHLSDRVLPVLTRHLDFAALTRRAIGPAWSRFSRDEQQRATTAFSVLIVRSYATRLDGRQRPEISYEPAILLSAGRWEIPSKVSVAGTPYRIGYRVERSSDAWRIYDIVVEGVSLVANYRAQLGAIFQKGGAAAVLQALERQVTPPAGD